MFYMVMRMMPNPFMGFQIFDGIGIPGLVGVVMVGVDEKCEQRSTQHDLGCRERQHQEDVDCAVSLESELRQRQRHQRSHQRGERHRDSSHLETLPERCGEVLIG